MTLSQLQAHQDYSDFSTQSKMPEYCNEGVTRIAGEISLHQ